MSSSLLAANLDDKNLHIKRGWEEEGCGSGFRAIQTFFFVETARMSVLSGQQLSVFLLSGASDLFMTFAQNDDS
jgi:hypothetical protein